MSALLRSVPKVDRVLATPEVQSLLLHWPRGLVLDAVRAHLEQLRHGALQGVPPVLDPHAVVCAVEATVAPGLRPVINATGVLLHTNLGRAPISPAAVHAIEAVATGYSNLEYDLEPGRRGDRSVHCGALLTRLTGAEAALVVNNNAAAMVLALAGLASGREAVVSRGELIEIGGSFRLPEIFETSGVRLVEVGTTNRTRLSDYERAIRQETALLVKAHRSNFEVVGFTEETPGADLAALGRARGVQTLFDLGSGCMVNLQPYGLSTPTVPQVVAEGWDVVAVSGDKLLGGPQAGILLGRRDVIATLARHPLLRALRVDKLIIAALERTLASYLDGSWQQAIPLFALLGTPVADLMARAEALRAQLPVPSEVVPLAGRMGGGTLPTATIAGAGLRVPVNQAHAVAARLRLGTPAVVARIEDGALVVDLRAVPADQLSALGRALHRALS